MYLVDYPYAPGEKCKWCDKDISDSCDQPAYWEKYSLHFCNVDCYSGYRLEKRRLETNNRRKNYKRRQAANPTQRKRQQSQVSRFKVKNKKSHTLAFDSRRQILSPTLIVNPILILILIPTRHLARNAHRVQTTILTALKKI